MTGLGPQGGDKHFRWDQNVASAVWNIPHNLRKYPSVTVVDSAGTMVMGDLDYVDENNVTLTFSSPFSGTAHLN